jgi:hypothetical protein
MPYKDPEKRKASVVAWRKRVMDQGYGKWLYARRKLRFQDAENFRSVLEEIIEISVREGHGTLSSRLGEINFKATLALEESRKAEEALGSWEPPTS